MENLLKNDFTSHYGLPSATVLIAHTRNAYFELKDDEVLIYPLNQGIAKYDNPRQLPITIINYDKFVTALPDNFQKNKERCDLIVYSEQNKYFLLNELKDRKPVSKVRIKAISQLLASLKLILAVKTIKNYIDNFNVKQCCYCNKQSKAPPSIEATTAFSRVNTYSKNGFRMSNPDIESLGFELWEFSGTQTYLFYKKEEPADIKVFAKQLANLTLKEANEFAEILKSEYSIK
jgi:hypothetical protein